MIRRHMGEQLHDSVTVGDEQTPTCHCTVLGLVFLGGAFLVAEYEK